MKTDLSQIFTRVWFVGMEVEADLKFWRIGNPQFSTNITFIFEETGPSNHSPHCAQGQTTYV